MNSPSHCPPPADLARPDASHEDRLVDLEVKAAYADDQFDQLSEQIYRQQQQIDALLRELRLLRERMPEAAGHASVFSPRDELPPHY